MPDRREFLRVGAAAVASLLLTSHEPVPEPAVALGLWPGGPDYPALLEMEERLGRRVAIFRERGARGSLDQASFKSGMLEAVRGYRRGSLELDPRVGGSQAHNYVSFASVLSGHHDERIRARAREILELPRGPHLLELSSEANLDKHHAGTPENYRRFCAHVREIFEAQGVSNVVYCCSLTAPAYGTGEADGWIDPDVIEWACVDGYARPRTDGADGRRSFEQIFDPARRWAQARGMPWAITEVGVQEDPDDADFKAGFWRGALNYTRNVPYPPRAMVVNHSDDSAGGWMLDSSADALEAFKVLAGDQAFAGS